MPFHIKKSGNRYCVYNKNTGDKKGCSTTKEKAKQHMKSLYAAIADEDEEFNVVASDILLNLDSESVE